MLTANTHPMFTTAGHAHAEAAEPRRPDEAATLSSVAFATLLSQFQAPGHGRVLRRDVARESQVFQPEAGDPRGRRLQQLKADARDHAQADHANRLAARRRVSSAGAGGTGVGAAGLETTASQTGAGLELAGGVEGGAGRRFAAFTQTGGAAQTNGAAPPAGSRASAQRPPSGSSPALAEAGRASPSTGRSHAGFDGGAAAAPPADLAAVRPGASLGERTTPAEQIGRWLASATSQASGDTKGASPASALTAPGQGHTAGAASRQPTSGRPAAAGASPAARDTAAAPPGRFEDVLKSIRPHGAGRSVARMQLDPPDLGRMRVEARLADARLDVFIRTESPEAAERVHERLIELQHALERQGVHVQRIDVTYERQHDPPPPDRQPEHPGDDAASAWAEQRGERRGGASEPAAGGASPDQEAGLGETGEPSAAGLDFMETGGAQGRAMGVDVRI